ncbi:NmrA family NAD(P)-binding protein [Variovorax sp. J22R115]|uniref:NmrA family NAD(P)-binding protein n=1 Tax=Variovorax sp. J22R115 TaxID=3053509 RepID=UPI0025761033|nr:NmrA family NAD(P)-binding protein [Variovorax sp. J22R115]MDM0050118.1 NAD(P)H-binding protein [Variovorax sp. J22R115]
MNTTTITVMGATGHTGAKIAQRLLKSGAKVRALGRTESKLAALRSAGAEVRTGDVADAGFLAEAFRGADAAYTLLATDRHAPDYAERQAREGEAIAGAVRDSGVSHVVALSSLGANLHEATGVIAGLHAQEGRLQRIAGINLLLLRPASFFENFFEALDVVRHMGVLADSVAPDIAMPMVAADDIAAVAAKALMERDWSGIAVQELLGPRDLSQAEVARILGQRIGQPDLHYVQLPDADMADALVGAGLSASFADLYVEMTRAFNANRVHPLAGCATRSCTPTTFEHFAGELAGAYAALLSCHKLVKTN